MKKYQQLLLAILSVFSFLCLLIYRHEYNKLRYVLEVLNFFGTPGDARGQGNYTSCSERDPFYKYEGPLPSWQRISNDVFVYSAYWNQFDDKHNIKAYAVGNIKENSEYGCYVWYSDKYSRHEIGGFSFSVLEDINSDKESSTGIKPYLFNCKSESKLITPTGVSFFLKSLDTTHQGFLSVHSLESYVPFPKSTVICVMPTQFPYFSKSSYLEFLSFHKAIGISKFFIYGGFNQFSLLSSIQLKESNGVDLIILPWNYPFYTDDELARIIVENDCKTRASANFDNAIVLDWNMYLVPQYKISVGGILEELDRKETVNRFTIPTLLFCLEHEKNLSPNNSIPLIFRKLRYVIPKVDYRVSLYKPHVKSNNVQIIGRNVLAVHKYIDCREKWNKVDDLKRVSKTSKSMLKFQNDFFKYQIVT